MHATAAASVYNQIKVFALGYFRLILDSSSNIAAIPDGNYLRLTFTQLTHLVVS